MMTLPPALLAACKADGRQCRTSVLLRSRKHRVEQLNVKYSRYSLALPQPLRN